MLLSLSLLASTIIATPTDLLDRIHAKRGWAFVPATNRRMDPILNPRKSDPIVLGNLARRWNLAYRSGTETVAAVALPMDAVFPSESQMLARYRLFEPEVFRRTITSRDGMVLRVAELLDATGVARERCHWYFHDRLVLARIDPARMEAALPDLAASLGAKYDAKAHRIEFDPKRFRALLAQSIAEDRTPRMPRQGDPWSLALLMVDLSSDTELTRIYADWKPKQVVVPLVAGRLHPILQTYIDARVVGARKDPNSVFANLDETVAPTIEYFPTNGVSVRVTRKDGSMVVF